jgi:hypothetical protein
LWLWHFVVLAVARMRIRRMRTGGESEEATAMAADRARVCGVRASGETTPDTEAYN